MDIYKGQQDLNSEFAGFTSAFDVNSYQERNRLFADNYGDFITPEQGTIPYKLCFWLL